MSPSTLGVEVEEGQMSWLVGDRDSGDGGGLEVLRCHLIESSRRNFHPQTPGAAAQEEEEEGVSRRAAANTTLVVVFALNMNCGAKTN